MLFWSLGYGYYKLRDRIFQYVGPHDLLAQSIIIPRHQGGYEEISGGSTVYA